MKKDLCELIVIIDESGSMDEVWGKTITGFNEFVQTHQKLPGEAKLTLVKFNTEYNIVHNGLNVKDVPLLNNKTYVPNGMTALLDAVGKTIDEVGKRLSNTAEDERPEKVIVLIITDGYENSSKEYTGKQVAEKIKKQTDVYSWEFVYMGADQDAIAVGGSMNMTNTVNFNKLNIGHAMKGATYHSSNSRTKSANTSMANYALSDEELTRGIDELINKVPNADGN